MGFQATNAGLKPANWSITSNDGTNVVAFNDITKATFTGTLAAFNAMFAGKALAADDSIVSANTNPVTGGLVNKTYVLTQAQYDALVTKDANTLYVIVG